ncbi:MAG: hypothetical protein CVU44_00840 [Chloroflexi bacterium HGW-Chloroflexi-6]|nr:MAG: hypothetical protein CVU44_00840 [Chloroflexi bacterium HGW-Chloroflexi-6]
MPDNTNFKDRTEAETLTSSVAMQKWGGVASFLMAAALIVSGLIYLTGNLRDALGPLAYSLADFLYGPLWAASLVSAVSALRERIGQRAARRMDLALLASIAAACAFVAVACIRSANRYYHLGHPELDLEMSSTVLIVWTTLVAGVIGAAWHFLGWAWILIGASAWTSRSLPRFLSGLYFAAGAVALFVYLLPDIEPNAVALGVMICLWQAILLWKSA